MGGGGGGEGRVGVGGLGVREFRVGAELVFGGLGERDS